MFLVPGNYLNCACFFLKVTWSIPSLSSKLGTHGGPQTIRCVSDSDVCGLTYCVCLYRKNQYNAGGGGDGPQMNGDTPGHDGGQGGGGHGHVGEELMNTGK